MPFNIMDNYPVMSEYSCDYQGIMGNCGSRCPLLENGDCDIEDEFLSDHGVEARPELPEFLFFELGVRDV